MASGADAVARTLRAHGVTTIFGLCGDHTNPLFEACDDASIRIVDARDERGAAWMAAGWALATGRPGVVAVSNTPALTNAATALADANASGHPVLCITGGVALEDRGRGHPGDLDQIAIAAPLSRWAHRATRADDAAASTAEGLLRARGPRPGVAVLELPMDVQHGATDAAVPGPVEPARASPRSDALAIARAWLSEARRPVIIAGSGVWWSGAGAALQRFVESTGIPAFTVRAARGLISDDHELCFGFPNLLAPVAQTIYGEADVVLVLGCELDVLLGNGMFHDACRMIRVDADANAFAVGRKAECEIVADIAVTIAALADGAGPLPTTDWVTRLRALHDERAQMVGARADISQTPLHPGRLVAEIAQKLPRDAIVCVDAGELALWAIDAIPARASASLHLSSASQLGALGMGLPWAIGMKCASPERPVLVLAGDGSFGFTAMEIETAARHNAPVGVVVGNDGGWGIVRHLQQDLHGRALASDLPRSPYELLAEFAGGVGDVVRTPAKLGVAVTNALAARLPSIINALIDPNIRHEAIPLIAAMFAAKAARA